MKVQTWDLKADFPFVKGRTIHWRERKPRLFLKRRRVTQKVGLCLSLLLLPAIHFYLKKNWEIALASETLEQRTDTHTFHDRIHKGARPLCVLNYLWGWKDSEISAHWKRILPHTNVRSSFVLELMDLAHSYSDSFFSHVAGGLGFPSMKGGGFYAPFVRLHSAWTANVYCWHEM